MNHAGKAFQVKSIGVAITLLELAIAPPSRAASATVAAWGANRSGELDAPAGLTNVVAIAAGRYHSLALKADGTVAGWGLDDEGQATAMFKRNRSFSGVGAVRIAATCCVTVDGTVLTNVVGVAAGAYHSLGLEREGTVICWGDTYYGQSVPSGLSNVMAIASGAYQCLALLADGTLIGWGLDGYYKTNVSNVVAIAVGSWRRLALRSDGTVIGLGTPIPAGLTNVVALSVGYNHNLALRRDGTVFGWGFNRSGQATGISTVHDPFEASGLVSIGGRVLDDVVAVSAGTDCSLALKRDGTVVGWGNNSDGQTTIPPGLSNVVAIAAGEHHCLAITTNLSWRSR